MQDINSFFHSLADEGDKIRAAKKDDIGQKLLVLQSMAINYKKAKQEKNELLKQMALALGINTEDFINFFNS